MKLNNVIAKLLVLLFVPMAAACSGEATCETMCDNLIDELGGCDQKEGDSRGRCLDECEEHLDDGSSSDADVECATDASSCSDFKDCGDVL